MKPQKSVDKIMAEIYAEAPEHWPCGLSPQLFDGGTWPIKDEAGDVVGFTGWQVRNRSGKKVGYYSVGVLAPHRRKGLAKKALEALLAKKRDTVDTVQALIVDGNAPSTQLAKSLNISIESVKPPQHFKPVIKSAFDWRQMGKLLAAGSPGRQWGKALAAGVATDAVVDSARHGGLDLGEWWQSKKDNGLLGLAMPAINTVLFRNAFGHGQKIKDLSAQRSDWQARLAQAGGKLRGYKAETDKLTKLIDEAARSRAATYGGILGKDLAVTGITQVPKFVGTMTDTARAMGAQAKAMASNNKAALGGLGILGLLGLSLAASQHRQAAAQEATADKDQSGKIRITLPTKKPGDQETQLEMPLRNINMSNAIQSGLRRDTLRRLRAETASRTYRRPGAVGTAATPTIEYA